jgi:hypothetical protein
MPERQQLDCFARLGKREKRFYSIGLGKGRDGHERHIALSDYNIDNGLPFRAILYFAVAEFAIWLLAHVPPTSLLLGAFPPIARYSVFPVAITLGLTVWEPDGRPALGWLASWAWHRCTPRTSCCGEPVRPSGRTIVLDPVVAITPDLSLASLPDCDLHGPAVVRFTDGVVITAAHADLTHGTARPANREDLDEDVVVDLTLDAGDLLTIQGAAA